jgi:hypothetical protein
MFERYTEKARRVIFYARYDASQYGSPYIETEHLLLGLLREDHNTAQVLLPNLPSKEQIRQQVESRITQRERISTSVEVPLTKDSKRVLNVAAEEAERFGHHRIGTEHLLLALLRVEEGMASEILRASKVDLARLRERIGKLPPQASISSTIAPSSWTHVAGPDTAIDTLQQFVRSLRAGDWPELGNLFAKEASFIDATGNLWSGSKHILANLENLLAPFAKKNSKYHIETQIGRSRALWVCTILWAGIHLNEQSFPEPIRMTLVFGNDAGEWSIFLTQISSVAESKTGKTAAT